MRLADSFETILNEYIHIKFYFRNRNCFSIAISKKHLFYSASSFVLLVLRNFCYVRWFDQWQESDAFKCLYYSLTFLLIINFDSFRYCLSIHSIICYRMSHSWSRAKQRNEKKEKKYDFCWYLIICLVFHHSWWKFVEILAITPLYENCVLSFLLNHFD